MSHQQQIAYATIVDARRLASRLEVTITIYAVLGGIGGAVLFLGESPALGLVALLTTALTAGCAWALVHVVRLLAVIAERDLPPVATRVRSPGWLATTLSGTGVFVLMTVIAVGVLVAVVVAALW